MNKQTKKQTNKTVNEANPIITIEKILPQQLKQKNKEKNKKKVYKSKNRILIFSLLRTKKGRGRFRNSRIQEFKNSGISTSSTQLIHYTIKELLLMPAKVLLTATAVVSVYFTKYPI